MVTLLIRVSSAGRCYADSCISKNPYPKNRISLEIQQADQGSRYFRLAPRALLKVGDGRIAVFGEAASFTAQLAGPQKRRMNGSPSRQSKLSDAAEHHALAAT